VSDAQAATRQARSPVGATVDAPLPLRRPLDRPRARLPEAPVTCDGSEMPWAVGDLLRSEVNRRCALRDALLREAISLHHPEMFSRLCVVIDDHGWPAVASTLR
jgi:hypothetical protein